MRSLLVLGSFAVPARVNSSIPASRSLPPRCRYYATRSNHDDGWEVVIGLEIHAQLKTGRKLFSSAGTVYGAPVNSQVEPNDAAFPGSLPSLDLKAIKLSVMTALALQCTINPRSTFDRKHYFYKDIPASYQITQHYNPLARSGHLKIDKGDNGSQRDLIVGIQQLQVEQDTAKSQVVGHNSLIDLNRAGTGLMEIVTDPDMRSAEEAGAFVKKLQSLLRRIGSGDGDMEKGNLRVDANISVHRPGTPFGTRSEIKNLNSVRFLQQAIEYERSRHIEHYTTNPTIPLPQETRTLNELTGQTYALRTKEDAQDYRYMPDPNLPAMAIEPTYIEHLKSSLPELPGQTVHRLIEQYGVPKKEVETLIGLDEYHFQGVVYFEQVSQGDIDLGKRALNLIVHEILGNLNKKNQTWTPDLIPASLMREVAIGVESRYITGTTGKAVLKHLLDHSESTIPSTTLSEILDRLGMTPSTSALDDLRIQCEQVIADSPGVVGDIRKGKISAVGRLVGQVMRVSKGSADAQKAREVILEILGVTP